MNSPALTIALRETDRPREVLRRLNRLVQSATSNDDLEIPIDPNSVEEMIKAAQSYLKGAYSIELRCVGYASAEIAGVEEWVLAVRIWNQVGGYSTIQVGYDPLT